MLQVALADDDVGAALLLSWRTICRVLAARLGWPEPETVVRRHPGGAQCFLSAPLDALLTATEVNEAGWMAAELVAGGHADPDVRDLVARVRVHAQHDSRPALVALHRAAAEHAVTFTFDDESASLGAGVGSQTYPLTSLPAPASVDWATVHDIPVALVTGSNGKTTTTRLLAAMLTAAGHVTGLTSTDGVWCAGTAVATGDYAGPAGARLVLRDRRVTAAVLETARGGMLRRGLATGRAAVAVVTRVSADHMGEYGVHNLRALGEAKLLVSRALVPGGRLVLNAEDVTLVTMASALDAPITWFALDSASPVIATHRARHGEACLLRDGELWAISDAGDVSLGPVARMPFTLGGAARHNIANAAAAAAAALAMHVPVDAIRATLARFGSTPDDNPGRLSQLEYRGARVVVDFAHNPDGWHALSDALSSLPAVRRLVVAGQAGDRDDQALAELAEAVWSERPDIIILKEMPKYLRGRESGAITARLIDALLALGVAPSAIRRTDSELAAVRLALAESRPGDLVVLTVHEDYAGVMRLLRESGAGLLTTET